MSLLENFINDFKNEIREEFEADAPGNAEYFEEQLGFVDDEYDIYDAISDDYDMQKAIRNTAWNVATNLLLKDEKLCAEYVDAVYNDNKDLVISALEENNVPFEIVDGKVSGDIKKIAEIVMYEFDFGEVPSDNDLQSEAESIFVETVMEEFE